MTKDARYRSDKAHSHIRTTIAFCGTRGVPANYGGFETAVDEISCRFVTHGYNCEVFCRLSSSDKPLERHQGRRLVYVRGSNNRKLDTFVSSIQTGWYLWRHRKRYAHVLWFNNANFPGILLTRLARIPMSVNTDGLEWRRAKWSWPFKVYYFSSSFLVSRFCRSLVSDSHALQSYYHRRFFKKTSFIPYGVPDTPAVPESRQIEILKRFDLEKNRYFLQITRIEPDNLPLQVASAFQDSGLGDKGFKMVFVGYKDPTPYAQQLIAYDGRYGIQVRDALYDQETLYVLRKHCYCYVHGNSVGGTNPALLEAMAVCHRVMAINCEFSREVLGDMGLFFDPANIASAFHAAVRLEEHSTDMQRRISRRYQWDDVVDSYMRLAERKPANYEVKVKWLPAAIVRDSVVTE